MIPLVYRVELSPMDQGNLTGRWNCMVTDNNSGNTLLAVYGQPLVRIERMLATLFGEVGQR